MSKYLAIACIFFLLVSCKSPPQAAPHEVTPKAEAPETVEPEVEIREPVFTIASISIEQASLVNTVFKYTLKIDNPNTFPITVFSFRYELYGNGRLWGGGIERGLAAVPAQGSSETKLSFEMNFIDMPRSLLDEVIAMKYVRYRLTGEAEIRADMPTPAFRTAFEFSGESEVKK